MGKSGDSKNNRENEIVGKYEGGKSQPILLNIGIAIAFSVAGFMLSQIRLKAGSKSIVPPSEIVEVEEHETNDIVTQDRPEFRNAKATSSSIAKNSTIANAAKSALISLSPTSKTSGEEENFLLPEFNDLILEEFQPNGSELDPDPNRNLNQIQIERSNQMDEEISFLKNLVCSLEERENSLELQVSKFNGMKEQEVSIRELQNQLNVNNVETQFYTLRMESLLSENHNLRAQLSDYNKLSDELEEERKQVRVLKLERMSTGEDEKLKEIERLEEELRDLEKVNARLEEEKLQLVRRAVPVRIDANSIRTSKEADALEEANLLRQENENLKKEIEQTKMDRCTDLEELVYLKWINACLRYELRDYNPSKTLAKDLSMTLSPESKQIAKQLISEYAYNSGPDDFNFDFNWEYSSLDSSSKSVNSNSNKKMKLFGKLRKLILGKNKGETSFRGTNSSSCEDMTSKRKSYDSNSSSSSMTEDLTRCRSDFGVNYRGKEAVVPLEGDSGNHFPGNEFEGNEVPEKMRLKKLADALKLSRTRSVGKKMDNRRTVSFSFNST